MKKDITMGKTCALLPSVSTSSLVTISKRKGRPLLVGFRSKLFKRVISVARVGVLV